MGTLVAALVGPLVGTLAGVKVHGLFALCLSREIAPKVGGQQKNQTLKKIRTSFSSDTHHRHSTGCTSAGARPAELRFSG